MPVTVKTTIIHKMIRPSRRILFMEATAEEMEKKTKGTTMVKSKLRKMSPKGLKITAFSLKINHDIAHDFAKLHRRMRLNDF